MACVRFRRPVASAIAAVYVGSFSAYCLWAGLNPTRNSSGVGTRVWFFIGAGIALILAVRILFTRVSLRANRLISSGPFSTRSVALDDIAYIHAADMTKTQTFPYVVTKDDRKIRLYGIPRLRNRAWGVDVAASKSLADLAGAVGVEVRSSAGNWRIG
jgi:hypothetical protein